MAIKTLTLIWLEVTFTVNRIAFFNDQQLLKHFWSFSKRKLPVMLGSSQKSSCLTHFENLLMSFCHERLFWVFLDFFSGIYFFVFFFNIIILSLFVIVFMLRKKTVLNFIFRTLIHIIVINNVLFNNDLKTLYRVKFAIITWRETFTDKCVRL